MLSGHFSSLCNIRIDVTEPGQKKRPGIPLALVHDNPDVSSKLF